MQKFLVLLCSFICAQQLLFAQAEKPFPFAHYNLNNGLAAYNANSIIQDRQGYIWIGTINGLQRFDGHHFITFRHNPTDKSSLPDSYIDHFLYDSRGNLWLVLGNGQVGIFDTRKFTYKSVHVKLRDERTLMLPRKLIEDNNGNLVYIIYNHELTTFNEKAQEFSAAFNLFTLPNDWNPISLADDPSSKSYWIATDSGMCVFNYNKKTVSYPGNNVDKIPFIDKYGSQVQFQNLMIDRNSRFWFTSKASATVVALISCYDLKLDSLLLDKQPALPGEKKFYEAKRMMQQKDGHIWIAGLNVLMRFSDTDNKFHLLYKEGDKSIDYREVNSLFEDRENNLWISTDNDGVFVINPISQQFYSIPYVNRTTGGQNEGSVLSMSCDRKGQILTGVWNDGIHRFDKFLRPFPSDRESAAERMPNNVWTMCRLKNQRTFWLGLQAGIMIYDVETGEGTYYNPGIFRDKLVRSIAEDNLGNIWVGAPGAGLFKWKPQRAYASFEAGFYKIPKTPNDLVEKIRVDSKGFVWVSTLMNGVYKIDPATDSILAHLTSFGPPNRRLLADNATDAFPYNDSIVLILTGALNIYNTRSNTITHITSADGLPSDILRSVEKDNKDNVWISMFNGICRVNLEKKTYTYYDRNDGMENDNFNYASSVHLPDGRIGFGTTSDFVIFDPDNLNAIVKPTDVTITDFRVLNKETSIDSLEKLTNIELGPDENFISIGFSSLSYFNRRIRYYYKLDGLEKEWKLATGLNQASYNFLPPGNYTFNVRAQNADGVSSEKITQLSIKVFPPFYRSWWFYSLMVLFAAFILYLIDRERMRRKEAMQRMRSDIADNLHEDVNTALNKINILSEMARLKAEKDPLKSSEFFEQIHQKSHDMIIAMDDMLWSIDPLNDSMIKIVDRIKEYIDALKRRYGANVDLLVDKRIEGLVMNMKLRHDVFILMKEGIRSVVQAGARTCRIHIGMQKDSLLYTIEIDNKDCDLQMLNNLLQQRILMKRLEAINANLTSYMHKMTSTFELLVPL